MKRVCIVGGGGYLGSYLARYLSADFDVTVFLRRPIDCTRITSGIAVSSICGDIQNKDDLNKIVGGSFDVIIYCISLNHIVSEGGLSSSIVVNFTPLQELVENLVISGFTGKFIYFSTMQVCGALNPGAIVDEAFPAAPVNNYGLTHHLCENVLSMYNKKKQLDACSIRLSNSYGFPVLNDADCWWLVVNDLCRSAVLNEKITLKSDGSPQRDFISLSDIGLAINILINSKENMPAVANLASGDTKTIYDLAKTVSELMLEMGKNITIEFLNKNQDNRVLSKKKPPFKIQTHYFRSLGFEPTISLRVGISDLLQQLIREYPRH